MSQLGPFAIFSQDEITKFSAIANAQEAENTDLVKVLASKLNSTEKGRYNQFADIALSLAAEQDQMANVYDTKIAAAEQRAAVAKGKIDAEVQAYTPAYKASMNQAVTQPGAHAANNEYPTKKKKSGTCNIL